MVQDQQLEVGFLVEAVVTEIIQVARVVVLVVLSLEVGMEAPPPIIQELLQLGAEETVLGKVVPVS